MLLAALGMVDMAIVAIAVGLNEVVAVVVGRLEPLLRLWLWLFCGDVGEGDSVIGQAGLGASSSHVGIQCNCRRLRRLRRWHYQLLSSRCRCQCLLLRR